MFILSPALSLADNLIENELLEVGKYRNTLGVVRKLCEVIQSYYVYPQKIIFYCRLVYT